MEVEAMGSKEKNTSQHWGTWSMKVNQPTTGVVCKGSTDFTEEAIFNLGGEGTFKLFE